VVFSCFFVSFLAVDGIQCMAVDTSKSSVSTQGKNSGYVVQSGIVH